VTTSWFLQLPRPEANQSLLIAESAAAWSIGKHLLQQGGAVPELHGQDAEAGLVLFADLGDCRLYDIVAGSVDRMAASADETRAWYQQAIDQLLVLQIEGGKGFQREWCWDTPKYDKALMLEKESGYFLRALWLGLLGQPEVPGVHEEFAAIADVAAEPDAEYFLHRDCQSRNIMVVGDELRFIDFQGGRLGPLGYDLASLLIDPYVALPLDMQAELVDYYRRKLKAGWGLGDENFLRHYEFLALQRNLQIVGAFAFLFSVRGKIFFKTFLVPALNSLALRLEQSVFADYHQLRWMVATAQTLLAKS